MENTTKFNHESENVCEACGINEKKFDKKIAEFNKVMRTKQITSISKMIEYVIGVCDSVEEVILMTQAAGISINQERK